MMALKGKVALLVALMGTTIPAALMAQTATTAPAATPPAATDTTTTAPAPAADATGTTTAPAAGEVATTTTTAPASGEAATGTATTPTDGAAAPATTTTTTTTTEAPAAGATEAATPAPTAAAAAPGPAQPAASAAEAQVGGFYLDGTQGDWQVRCQKTPEGKDPCELYQLMRDPQNNPVAEASVVPLSGKAAAGVTIVGPLETDLLPGLGFKIDGGKTAGYPFSFCSPVGCFSRVAFTQAELDAMRKGNAVTVSLVPFGAPAGTKVDLKLSLKGFSAGFDAVKARAPAAPVGDAKPAADGAAPAKPAN